MVTVSPASRANSSSIEAWAAQAIAPERAPGRRANRSSSLRRERADSALDRRQRFVLSSLYTLPYFSKSDSHLVRMLLGGFNFAGTLTYESGAKATVSTSVS